MKLDTSLLRYKAQRVLTFGTVTLAFALVFNLYASIPFHSAQLVWFLLGILIGLVEQAFFRGRVAHLPVYVQLVVRVAIISVICFVAMPMGRSSGTPAHASSVLSRSP